MRAHHELVTKKYLIGGLRRLTIQFAPCWRAVDDTSSTEVDVLFLVQDKKLPLFVIKFAIPALTSTRLNQR